jgi:MFS family permease
VKNQTAANPAYVNFPNFFDRTILAVALEPFRREFGLDDTSLGLHVAAGTSLGYLADRYNRKVIITIALIVWSVMTGVTGIAWSFPGFGTIVTGALSDMFARNAMAAARAAEMTEAFHAEGLHSVILFVVPFGMLTTAIFLRRRLRERHRIPRDTDSSNDWRRKWTRLRSLISTFQRFLASSACPAST